MKLNEITNALEEIAPLSLQESYDNAGLLIGDKFTDINKILISLDVTEEVIEEAINKGCNLIISHHPIIFSGLKRITGGTYVERIVAMAIKNDIALYAAHTNLDNIDGGVNSILCDKLGLKNKRILSPKKEMLRKLVTFCPVEYAERVRNALFAAGAGHIGNYDNCSYNVNGTGTFRGSEDTNPFVGEKGKLHFEEEVRIETVFPVYREQNIISALLNAHPYEEVAYDIYTLSNDFLLAGAGMVGEPETEVDEIDFLNKVKEITGVGCIRHTALTGKKIKKVAVCGGSGSFLIKDAIRSGADIFLTGDIKYHEFFDADGKIVIADIGHYESEQFAKDLIYSVLIKKFSNFAVLISEVNTNIVNYL
jgi:dinuclear metal center YbgI/SA1388 family protein